MTEHALYEAMYYSTGEVAASSIEHTIHSAPAGYKSDQLELKQLLTEYQDVFEIPGQRPDSRVKHRIDLIDESKQPPKHHYYRISYIELDKLPRQLDFIL